jgi:hypothetical protein
MLEKRIFLRNFRKGIAVVAICLAGVTVFSGCDKDGNGRIGGNASKITATNVINSSSQIATVKAEIYWETSTDWGSDAIAQVPYKDNGFTLELPATVLDKYLYLLAEDVPDGITISDKTAKCNMTIDIKAYDNKANNIGGFYLSNGESAYAMWAYVDKNVTIKGEYEESGRIFYKYNMDLKKGWNVVYINSSTDKSVYERITITTQKLSGVNFSWYFLDYHAVSLKSEKPLLFKKSFFYQKSKVENSIEIK